jgi:hypothetical protein
MREAMITLMRLGWGADNPSFRQMFTARFIPGGTHEQADYFNELQLRTTSPECAARYFDVVSDFDITDLLSEVKAPTLVMHVRDDVIVPFEFGRQLAAGIARGSANYAVSARSVFAGPSVRESPAIFQVKEGFPYASTGSCNRATSAGGAVSVAEQRHAHWVRIRSSALQKRSSKAPSRG